MFPRFSLFCLRRTPCGRVYKAMCLMHGVESGTIRVSMHSPENICVCIGMFMPNARPTRFSQVSVTCECCRPPPLRSPIVVRHTRFPSNAHVVTGCFRYLPYRAFMFGMWRDMQQPRHFQLDSFAKCHGTRLQFGTRWCNFSDCRHNCAHSRAEAWLLPRV